MRSVFAGNALTPFSCIASISSAFARASFGGGADGAASPAAGASGSRAEPVVHPVSTPSAGTATAASAP